MKLIDNILTEWAYRVHDGMPNPKNPMHIVKLKEALREYNFTDELISELISNLTEQSFYARSKKSGKIVQYKNKDNYEKGIEDGSHEKVDKAEAEKELGLDKKDDEKPPSKPKMTKIANNPFSTDDEVDDKKRDDAQQSKDDVGDKDVQKARAKFGETYTKSLDTSRDEFNLKNRENQTKNVYTLPDGIKNNPKIPKRYTQLLERSLNTNRNADDNTDRADYYGLTGVGAGNIESNLGELMTMMATTLRRKDREEFFNGVDNHLSKTKYDKQSTHVSEKWVKAAKENSSAILRLFYDRYGSEYEITAGAWDVEEEVRDMGFDYSEKGFSTDIFFKLKTKLGDVVPEISLKQALQANLLNSSVGAVFGDVELPMHLKPSTFSDNEVSNNDKYFQNNQTNVRTFVNDIDITDKEFLKTAKEVGMIMSNNKPIQADRIVSELVEMVTNAKEDLLSNEQLVIDRNYVGSIRQAGAKTKGGFTGGKKETLKPLFMLGRIMAQTGDETAVEFVKAQDRLGKDYAKGILQHINDKDEAKSAVLKTVQQKLPLKSVSNGEEDIVLGQYNLTKKTLKGIFGTDDWNKIKDSLEVDSESDPPTIQYSGLVRGTETKIPISTIKVREDGIGYKGAHKFDMVLDTSFAKRVKSVSDTVYGAQEELPYPVGILEPGGREPVGN
tara:strand:+ start:73 stop:2082 length:2010 start_codon:yes stop_codon:yes gene_type:complete